MNPRFMTPLFFECDGTLEVCGPTNFGPDDVLLEITELTIVDAAGNRMSPRLPVTAVAPNLTWETEIPGANRTLKAGPATGAAGGYVVTRRVGRVPIAWPGSLTLEDGCAILEEVDPELVDIWNDYLRIGRDEQKAGRHSGSGRKVKDERKNTAWD